MSANQNTRNELIDAGVVYTMMSNVAEGQPYG
ncbi:hypothetical protein HNQ57_001249 [Zhongshania antarctica]|uniref:Uncharacterized protein n=1 Tax=Zhongshania antarctica TaxID=641702 RepID=A0A840R375_9GAMM|nr:hypothetical protein [Zhongshania antarctica]